MGDKKIFEEIIKEHKNDMYNLFAKYSIVICFLLFIYSFTAYQINFIFGQFCSATSAIFFFIFFYHYIYKKGYYKND